MSLVSTCILTLANVLLSASAGEIQLKLLPEKADLLFNKWPVNFTCTLSSDESYNTSDLSSANLTFVLLVRRKGRRPIPTHDHIPIPDSCTTDINSKTLALIQCEHVASYAKEVSIQCRLKHNNSVKSNSSKVNIRLAHPQPEILVSETGVYNWASLTLLVNTAENRTSMYAMNYSLWVRNDSDNSVYQRIHPQTPNDTFLKANVDNPFSFLADDVIVKVNGTAKQKDDTRRIIETVSSPEVRLNLNQFVKPAPVSGIRTHQNDSSTLTVSFVAPRLNRNITYNIVTNCSKTHVNYTVNTTHQVEGLDPNESQGFDHFNNTERYCMYTLLFTALPPVTSCTVSVRAISAAGGKWSEWNSHSFETVEGVPLRNPDVCSSCFSAQRDISESTFAVTVYFIPLSDETAQGKVIVYRIRVLEKKVASYETVHYLNNTEVNHLSFHLSNLSSGADYEIGIEAATSRGYNRSLEKSDLIRFSPGNVGSFRSLVIDFTVTFLNNTATRINWALSEYRCATEKKTFLFWCKGNSRAKICSDALKSKSISSRLRSDVIVLTQHDSIFGIGLECDGKSSGILWNDCAYDINAIPAEPSVDSIQTSESSAAVLLDSTVSKECPASGKDRGGLTASYRVSYCPILRNESGFDGECSGAVTTSVHDRSPGGGGALVVLDGLGHSRTYRLTVQSVSETNLSSGTVTKVFSTKYRESTGAVMVFLVVTGVFVVVLIAVILSGCRVYIVSGRTDIPVVVKSSAKKITAVNLTRSNSYDEYVVTPPRNCDVPDEGVCCEEAVGSHPWLPWGRREDEQCDLGIGIGFSDAPEDALQPGVARVSPKPGEHSYCRVRPDPVLSFPVPVLVSGSLHGQKLPFEENVSRILPIVGGNLSDSVFEKDDSNDEDSPQKTEFKRQDQSKGSKSVSGCSSSSSSSSSCCSSVTQDYHCCVTTVKSAEDVKSGDAAAAADGGGGGDDDDAGDSGCGYVDGSARVVAVIHPPPSEPPRSLMRDHGGHGRNRLFADPYRLSVSSDGGGDDDDDDDDGLSGTTEYLEESNPSDFSGDISSESQVLSKTASSEDDGISLFDSSPEKLNGETTDTVAVEMRRHGVYPDPIRSYLDSTVSLNPILPVCSAPVPVRCPRYQDISSVSGSPRTPSLCDVCSGSGLASNEEDSSETDLSCLDESVDYRSDQLFTRPVDSELKFTSKSILPPILST